MVMKLKLHHPSEAETLTSNLKEATSLCCTKDKIVIGTSTGIL